MFKIRTTRISKWYYLGLFVWLGMYLLRNNGIIIPIVNSHLTDLYTVPMFCYTIEILMCFIFNKRRKTSFNDIIFSTLYITFLFEILCPRISDIYTGDVIDAICYLMGGLLYYTYMKYQNRTAQTKIITS